MARGRTFLDLSSGQIVVVCLLTLFIVVAIVAMCTTSGGVGGEMSWNGMWVEGMGADTIAAMGIPGNVGGVLVEHVEGAAARAGVQSGDVLQGINSIPVRDMAGFSAISGKTDLAKGGVQLIVTRRGMQIPIFVAPPGGGAGAQVPGQTGAGGLAQAAPGPDVQSAIAIDQRWLGIDADTLTPLQRNALGIPAGIEGVLIDRVTRGSRAEDAGLAGNDVIVSVNGWKTSSTAALWSTLSSLGGADGVEFGVYRSGQLMSFQMPIATGTPVGGFGMPGWCWGMGPGMGPGPAYPMPGREFVGQAGIGGWVPPGTLRCPNCGTTVVQPQGVSSPSVPCPSCNTLMVRLP